MKQGRRILALLMTFALMLSLFAFQGLSGKALEEESNADLNDGWIVFETENPGIYSLVYTTVIEKTVLASDGETYRITLSYGENAGIPTGAELAVEEILPGSDSSPAILPGEEITPEPADTVEFSSEKVREAVRSALGGGILTQERLTEVITIRLESDTLPETLSDLELLPALRTIQLTQSAAKDVPEHEELFRYTIELIGGTMP